MRWQLQQLASPPPPKKKKLMTSSSSGTLSFTQSVVSALINKSLELECNLRDFPLFKTTIYSWWWRQTRLRFSTKVTVYLLELREKKKKSPVLKISSTKANTFFFFLKTKHFNPSLMWVPRTSQPKHHKPTLFKFKRKNHPRRGSEPTDWKQLKKSIWLPRGRHWSNEHFSLLQAYSHLDCCSSSVSAGRWRTL